MIEFKETAYMMFGRFQPPTIGHQAILQEFYEKIEYSYWTYVFISPTVDKKTNPLTLEYREDILRELFPSINFVADETLRNPFDAVCFLGTLGFTKIAIGIGADRLKKFQSFKNYINHPDSTKTIPNVQEIELMELGHRSGESSNILDYVSSTMVRKAVVENDYDKFFKLIPKCSKEKVQDLFNSVSAGMTK
jgi:nicotinic acid mononucleotide adenylyltransferase